MAMPMKIASCHKRKHLKKIATALKELATISCDSLKTTHPQSTPLCFFFAPNLLVILVSFCRNMLFEKEIQSSHFYLKTLVHWTKNFTFLRHPSLLFFFLLKSHVSLNLITSLFFPLIILIQANPWHSYLRDTREKLQIVNSDLSIQHVFIGKKKRLIHPARIEREKEKSTYESRYIWIIQQIWNHNFL